MTEAPKKAPARRTAAKAAAATAPAKKETPAKTSEAASAPEASEVAASFAFTQFDPSQFDFSQTAMTDAARGLAEKSISTARESYLKSKETFEEQKSALEASYDCATSSAKDLNKKAIHAAQANMNAGFAFMMDLLGAKTLSDAVELQTSFAGKQLESLTAQSKDFQETITKSFEDVSAPLKTAADKAMEAVKVH